MPGIGRRAGHDRTNCAPSRPRPDAPAFSRHNDDPYRHGRSPEATRAPGRARSSVWTNGPFFWHGTVPDSIAAYSAALLGMVATRRLPPLQRRGRMGINSGLRGIDCWQPKAARGWFCMSRVDSTSRERPMSVLSHELSSGPSSTQSKRQDCSSEKRRSSLPRTQFASYYR